MKSLSFEEENIIKDVGNLLIIKKDIRKLRQERETKAIKDRILKY